MKKSLTVLLFVLSISSLIGMAGLLLPDSRVIIWCAVPLAVFSTYRVLKKINFDSFKPDLFTISLLIIFIVSSIFYLKPGESLFGNWDPGMYLAQGHNLSRTGTINPRDSLEGILSVEEIKSHYRIINGDLSKHPGFFINEKKPFELEASFYPLFPFWIAWAKSLTGSVYASLLVSSFAMWLGVLLVGLIGRQISNEWGGITAALIFAMNPVGLWFAGFQTGECFTQLFFLAGVWAWLEYRERDESVYSLLAGLCWGAMLFTSVTAILLLGIIGLALFLFVPLKKIFTEFTLSLILCGALLVLFLLLERSIYMENVFSYFYMGKVIKLIVGGCTILFVIKGLTHFMLKQEDVVKMLTPIVLAGFSFCVVLLIYFFYMKELPPSSRFWQLAVLFSRSIFLLGVFGWALHVVNGKVAVYPFIFVFAGVTIFFCTYPLMSSNWPWTFKRLLAVSLPLTVLGFTGYFSMAAIAKPKYAKGLSLLLAGVFLFGSALHLKKKIFLAGHRSLIGLTAYMNDLAAEIPEDVILVAEDWAATPMEFIYGKTVLPFKKLNDKNVGQINKLAEQGYQLKLLIQKNNLPAGMDLKLTEDKRFKIETRLLHQRPRPEEIGDREVKIDTLLFTIH